MKKLKLLMFTMALSLFINSCCTLTCVKCEIPDKNDCNCIVDIECQCNDGIKNGDEEFIDCGGLCDACACDYAPCRLLTNEASKVWKPVAIGDAFGNIIIRNPPDPFLLECRVDHTAVLVNTPVTWRFDSPSAPDKLIFTSSVGTDIPSNLVFLSADSLVLFFNTTVDQEHVFYIAQ